MKLSRRLFLFASGMVSAPDPPRPAPVPPTPPVALNPPLTAWRSRPVTVTYRVRGTGRVAQIMMNPAGEGEGEAVFDRPLPFEHSESRVTGVEPYTLRVITGSSNTSDDVVCCSVSIDDREAASAETSGPNARAECVAIRAPHER